MLLSAVAFVQTFYDDDNDDDDDDDNNDDEDYSDGDDDLWRPEWRPLNESGL